jgi:hypothetical protein
VTSTSKGAKSLATRDQINSMHFYAVFLGFRER